MAVEKPSGIRFRVAASLILIVERWKNDKRPILGVVRAAASKAIPVSRNGMMGSSYGLVDMVTLETVARFSMVIIPCRGSA